MKFIIKEQGKYIIMKQYLSDDVVYAKPIALCYNLNEAKKLIESEVPVNNVGSGNIQGLDLGYPIKKKKKKCQQI